MLLYVEHSDLLLSGEFDSMCGASDMNPFLDDDGGSHFMFDAFVTAGLPKMKASMEKYP